LSKYNKLFSTIQFCINLVKIVEGFVVSKLWKKVAAFNKSIAVKSVLLN
jgi:hypothetical protein